MNIKTPERRLDGKKKICENPTTECVWCEGYIHAGQYPPVCCAHCEFEVNLAIAYEKMAREYSENINRSD